MSSAMIAYLLIAGTLVAACAAAADALCRTFRWPRRWAWSGGMAALLALAIMAPLRSSLSPDAAASAPAGSQGALLSAEPVGVSEPSASSLAGDVLRRLQLLPSTLINSADRLLKSVQRAIPDGLSRWYLTLWIAGSSTLFLLLVLVHIRFIRARRGWPVTELHGVRVRVSPSAGPAVVGALRPDIVVPSWLLRRSQGEQMLVLAHERAHVQSRDPLILASAWVCATLLPWHPAVWWMLARLRLAVELDCDARVLARGSARQLYGALLIELSEQSIGLPVGATALADRTSQLERRLLAMNEKRSSFSSLRGGAFALLATLAFLSACSLRVPREERAAFEPAAEEAESVASRSTGTVPEQIAQITGGVGEPIYFIDGVRVTSQQGRAMPASLISSLETRRPASPGAPAEIRITSIMAAAGGAQNASRPQTEVDFAGRVQPPGATPPASPTRTAVAPPTATAPPRAPRPVIIVDGVVQQPPPPPSTPVPPRTDSTGLAPTPPVLRDSLGRVIPPTPPAPTPPAIRIRPDTSLGNAQFIGTIRPAVSITLPPDVTTPPVGVSVRTLADGGVVVHGTPALVIIDGVIQLGRDPADALDIDPTIIKSIEVVRGAAAVALYGERAANGVINITTKR